MNKFIFLVVFFLIDFAFAQEADAVLYFQDGTKLDGFGGLKGNTILFRLSQNDKADEWKYEDGVLGITFIGFDVKVELQYVRIMTGLKPELLELVTRGNVNLYRRASLLPQNNIEMHNGNIQISNNKNEFFTNPFFADKESYFVKRDFEDLPTEIKPVFFKKILKKYFSDCAILVEKINNNEFNMETLDKLVEYYDDICSD